MTAASGEPQFATAMAFSSNDTNTSALPQSARTHGAAHPFSSLIAYELVTERHAFDALEVDWNDLFDRAGHSHQVFQTFNWNWHWCNHFLTSSTGPARMSLAVLVGRRDGRVVTIWPMVLDNQSMLRTLSWMGEPVSQYGDVLIDRAIADPLPVLKEAWMFLKQQLQPDVARLRKVRDDAVIAPLLATLGSQRANEQEAPYLDLASAADFETYEDRYAKRSRRNRARLLRRLNEQGPVKFRHLEEGEAAATVAAQGIALKRTWLRERGLLSPALSDERTMQFMVAVAGSRSNPTGCRVAVLEANGIAAAIQINFACKGRLALHIIVYDLTFEKSGVGVLHIEEQIRNGFVEGLNCFDLLAPKAAYKMDWADGTVGVADHALGMSTKGRVYARIYLGFLRDRLKTLLGGMPLGLRRKFGAMAAISVGM